MGAVLFPSFSQTATVSVTPPTRKIEVAGFAELEVIPDENNSGFH